MRLIERHTQGAAVVVTNMYFLMPFFIGLNARVFANAILRMHHEISPINILKCCLGTCFALVVEMVGFPAALRCLVPAK